MVKCGVLFEVRTEFLNNIYLLDELRLQRINVRPHVLCDYKTPKYVNIIEILFVLFNNNNISSEYMSQPVN
jgi:hypothetical protein